MKNFFSFLKKQINFLPLQGRRGGGSTNFLKIKNNKKDFAGFSAKNPGITVLIPTIILSGLILVVGLGLSRVLMTELEFSADLLFSEKAYFAAESGVEKSLLALKNKPLNWVSEKERSLGQGTTYDLEISNSVDSFSFNLSAKETTKFRLGVDLDSSFFGYSLQPIKDFQINISQGNKKDLQWKILCQNSAKKTVALYGDGTNFVQGDYDDGVSELMGSNRSSFLTQSTANNICFMSLTNLGQDIVKGTFSVQGTTIAPAKVKITARGKSFSREKIVSFEYLQKNLSSLFDLGLYFTGK